MFILYKRYITSFTQSWWQLCVILEPASHLLCHFLDLISTFPSLGVDLKCYLWYATLSIDRHVQTTYIEVKSDEGIKCDESHLPSQSCLFINKGLPFRTFGNCPLRSSRAVPLKIQQMKLLSKKFAVFCSFTINARLLTGVTWLQVRQFNCSSFSHFDQYCHFANITVSNGQVINRSFLTTHLREQSGLIIIIN